jgi:hypothetical protein
MEKRKDMQLFILTLTLCVASLNCKDSGAQLIKDEPIPQAQTLKGEFLTNEEIGYVITNQKNQPLELHNCCPGMIVCYVDRFDGNQWHQVASYADPCVTACYIPRPVVQKDKPFFGTIESQASGTYRLRFVYSEVNSSKGPQYLTTNSFVVR